MRMLKDLTIRETRNWSVGDFFHTKMIIKQGKNEKNNHDHDK